MAWAGAECRASKRRPRTPEPGQENCLQRDSPVLSEEMVMLVVLEGTMPPVTITEWKSESYNLGMLQLGLTCPVAPKQRGG